MRRALWPLIVSVMLVGILFLFVFPARTFLDQRRRLAATQHRLHTLDRRNAELTGRVQLLNTDAEIERLAREQYSLVKPGEEAYAILPAPPPPSPPPRQRSVRPAPPASARPGPYRAAEPVATTATTATTASAKRGY
ncbi:MAG TPA: septum formation initiator family protein [Acidimicrobiales bacterium]|nr:septum formation initiator family protein [Acidimicrobiales bacterium]